MPAVPTAPTGLPGDLARAALDLVENMLVVTDADGVIVFVNDAFVRVTGYRVEDALGATPAILKSGVQDEGFYTELWARVLAGETWDGELVNRRRDGTLYTDRMTITPLRAQDGTITNFVAVKRDVTTHAAALTAGSPAGAAHVDATGRLVYANPRLELLLGLPFEELLGHGWFGAFEAAAREELSRAIACAAAGGEEHKVTVSVDATTVVRVHLAALDVGVDGPAGVVATFEDVTSEERAALVLREREQYVRAILDSLASPTAVVDANGIVRAVNETWRRRAAALGVQDGGIGVGAEYLRVCEESAAAGCDEAVAARDALAAVLAGDRTVRTVDYGSAEDGTSWELRVSPLSSDGGGAVLVHNDITSRRELEDLLRDRATTDELTGLYNRAGLRDRAAAAFARARRSGTAPVLLFLDLDLFKPVNDEHGHEAGDHVLRTCSERLRDVAREVDVVARVGGDEFVVLCEDVPSGLEQQIAGRFAAAVEVPITLDSGVQVSVGASVGVARGEGNVTLDDVLEVADARMYAAKAADGRGR